jgi:hypothetical protein
MQTEFLGLEVGAIKDAELSAKINEIKLFEHLHNENLHPFSLVLLGAVIMTTSPV